MNHTQRRRFLIASGALLAAPLAGAQQTAKTARIVLLSDYIYGRWPVEGMTTFRQRLRDLGWVEGRNLVIEEQHAASEVQRLQIAAEIERLRPDVIYACPPCSVRAAPSGTAPIRGIPIVFIYSDPVAGKLVESLARPGGNMTGLAYLGIELNAKRMQLLKDVFPKLVRIGVLVMKDHRLRNRMVTEVQDAASKLSVKLQLFEIASDEPAERIDTAFEAMLREGVQAVLGLQGAHFYRERKRITALALKHRLPGIFDAGEDVEAGALMTYDTDFVDLSRRSASYVDKILKGAKPSDLPVEQPNTFEFAINLRTAKTMGLTIPQPVLLRAHRVIE